MEAVKKIRFWEHECMCWEKDEFDQTLRCDPLDCEIQFCPVKELIGIIRGLTSKVNKK